MFSSPSILIGRKTASSGEDDVPISPTTALERKSAATTAGSNNWRSKLLFGSRSGAESPVTHPRTPELLAVLGNDSKLTWLMHKLLVEDNEAAVRVRFVSYVLQYENETSPLDKRRKLQGLGDLFLSHDAKCKMADLPPALCADPIRAKQFTINRLIDHYLVLEYDDDDAAEEAEAA